METNFLQIYVSFHLCMLEFVRILLSCLVWFWCLSKWEHLQISICTLFPFLLPVIYALLCIYICVGILSILMLRIACSIFGYTLLLVSFDSNLYIARQKFLRTGHDHSICARVPTCPHPLQHRFEFPLENFAVM